MTRFRMAESLDLGSGNQEEWELHLLPPSFCHATAAPVPTYTTSWGPSSPPSHFILPCRLLSSCPVLTWLSVQASRGRPRWGRSLEVNTSTSSL